MRKSIKKIAATLLAATMSMGLMVTAHAADIDVAKIAEGETVFTLTGNMTNPGWAPMAEENKMVASDKYEGLYEMTITMPAYDEKAQWQSRFSIQSFVKDSAFTDGWNRILVGNPAASAANTAPDGWAIGPLSNIRVLCEQETTVTVYFDSDTYGVTIKDAEGNDVPYSIGWCTMDDGEKYYTPDEFAEMTWDEYIASLKENDRKMNLQDQLGVTELPDFKGIKEIADQKVAGTYVENIDVTAIAEGETVFTLTGNMTNPSWAPMAVKNIMTKSDKYEGLYEMKITMPAYDETAQWQSRFSIQSFVKDSAFTDGWNRILLGSPAGSAANTAPDGWMIGPLSNIRVLCEEETEITVYFDSETYAVTLKDAEGKDVPYSIGWCTMDDNEAYYTPEEFAKMTWDEYIAGLKEADRAMNLGQLEVTAIPNFVELKSIVDQKVAGTYVPPTTTEAPTTAAPAPTTAAPAATTTASNQATETGDAAPVALLLVLMVSVAVVTVVAKKKEA